MSGISLRIVIRLVRAWTRLYTTGTTADLRDRRRAEIESDIWESCRQPQRASVPLQMLLRLLLGVHDDLAWRRSLRRPSRIAQTVMVAAMAAGALAAGLLLAIGRASVLPAPPPIVHRARALPPAPPPPPPPCVPPGIGRESPSPCVR